MNPSTIAVKDNCESANPRRDRLWVDRCAKAHITIADRHAQQSRFRDYPLPTMAETPEIEIHLVPSREPPSGAGECGVAPVAPPSLTRFLRQAESEFGGDQSSFIE